MKKFDQQFFTRDSESWVGMEVDELVGFLLPKCQEVITTDRLRQKISKHSTLKVKFGIDPTASEIHIGHVVPIMLLRQFAKAGHHIDFIIGDFTARVGDPTARDTSRVPLNPEQIMKNMETYTSQIGKYIDLRMLNIHYNAKWLNPMTLQEIFTIFQNVNLSEAMQREDFRMRMRNEQAVSLAEVCYGVLMGIDSVYLGTHVEIGGIDQLLNFQQCRKIMRQFSMDEEIVLMTPILEGTSGDGRKMSKSYGNYIAVNATHEDKFGKIMSIPDRLIGQYFRCFADVHQRELDDLDVFIEENPMEAKKQLATLIVAAETRCIENGLRERESFERKFSRKNICHEDCIELTEDLNSTIFDALIKSGRFKSKSELRRLFEQQGVRSINEDGEVVLSPEIVVNQVCGVVRVGKRHFFRFITG
ncbi:MAG: tyrosine--tRNA ligase [Candidatus Shapirobacteria bacterium]|nr:tyrosine--tRNA ligase [Candidatus Shapirobacteria bacterium]